MRTLFSATLLVLAFMPTISLAQDGLAGSWKFSIFEGPQQLPLWLFHIDAKDGKINVKAEPLRGSPRVKIDDPKQVGDNLTMKILASVGMGGAQTVVFHLEAPLPKPGAKKIYGSIVQTGSSNATPVLLEATNTKTVFDLNRETLQRNPADPRALVAIFEFIEDAKDNKFAVADLQEIIDTSIKASDLYGPRFSLRHQGKLLDALAVEKTYVSVALETARKVSKLVDPKLPIDTQLQILTTIANVFEKGGAKTEAVALNTRLEKIEGDAYAEYTKAGLGFKTPKFSGRKSKSTRTALIELFTGAQCPPCVAADVAFDGVAKAYGPTDVVLLQYHMHIPRPEPLSGPDSEARFEYYVEAYAKQIRGTPATLFNGKPTAPGGGGRDDAPEKFKEYSDVLDKLLETPTTITLTAKAVRNGDKIDIQADVKGVEKPGDKIKLRIALTEGWVRYKGSNGLQYHHHVVRALAGGAKGVAIKQKDLDHKVTVDLSDLRKTLNKYLDEDYPEGPRPLRLRDLSIVAFVQDDATAEVLQAVTIPVKE
ncbi:MAG: hypothetical protein EXS16_01675 [Gemmataceae bacterium]|nr:hypothetical protein [Gemmataceae bacterium]